MILHAYVDVDVSCVCIVGHGYTTYMICKYILLITFLNEPKLVFANN